MNYKEEFFKACAESAEDIFYGFRPRVVSIGSVPGGADIRVIFSKPRAIKLAVKALAEKIKNSDFDIICGCETAGIPLAANLAYELDKPFCYVRKEPKKYGRGDFIEGSYRSGQKALLVDDLLSSGKTKKIMINNLARCGVGVIDLVLLMLCEADYFENNPERIWLKQQAINIHYLYTWSEFINKMKELGVIPEALYPFLIDYVTHPENWQNNPATWEKYLAILRDLKIEIPQNVLEKIYEQKSS